ncbi:hypothetical protein HK101_000905 [Irineochytrium annulatum]|nr:hypothetical protein HK101_000905 [Irineochytrium annulatum]
MRLSLSPSPTSPTSPEPVIAGKKTIGKLRMRRPLSAFSRRRRGSVDPATPAAKVPSLHADQLATQTSIDSEDTLCPPSPSFSSGSTLQSPTSPRKTRPMSCFGRSRESLERPGSQIDLEVPAEPRGPFWRHYLVDPLMVSTGFLAGLLLSRRVRAGFFPLTVTPNTADPLASTPHDTPRIRTKDGALLDCLYLPSPDPTTSPTALLFHGNGMTHHDMLDFAQWYADAGINVLLPTMRGYPGSTGSLVESGELGIFYDVQALVSHAVLTLGLNRERMVAHGYSIGGAYACIAASVFGTHLTLDHTFTRPEAMIRRVMEMMMAGSGGGGAAGANNRSSASIASGAGAGAGCMGSRPSTTSWHHALPRGIASSTFAKGQVDPLPLDPINFIEPSNGLRFVANGLDNLARVGSLYSPTGGGVDPFLIYGREDELMDPAFVEEFMEARYRFGPRGRGRGDASSTSLVEGLDMSEAEVRRRDQVRGLEGGHFGFFGVDEEVSTVYAAHLRRIGLI